jgi:hypothetical protein
MTNSERCLFIGFILSAPGFLVSMFFPGALNRAFPETAAIAWAVVMFALLLVGVWFWMADQFEDLH